MDADSLVEVVLPVGAGVGAGADPRASSSLERLCPDGPDVTGTTSSSDSDERPKKGEFYR